MSPLHPLLRHTTKQQGAKLGYLESSFLRGSQRLPFWRVQELVWKDVVKELSVLAHSDPAERTHLGHKGDVTRTSSTHTTCRQPAPPGRKTSPYLMCVSYPLQDSCRCSHLRGCCSFLYGKGYLLPLPHIPSAFHFLVQSQPSWVQCLVLNQPFSPCKTAAAFQALISQLFVLASSSCPQGCTKTFPDLMLGSCYIQNLPKSHRPSFLTHHAASSQLGAHYHSTSLGVPSIPFPYFCYNCLPMSRSNLHPGSRG